MPDLVALKERSPRWLRDAAIVGTRAVGMATAPWRTAPDFLIVGAKRGGTTSLHNYLLMHPGVLGLYPKPRGQKSSDYFFRGLDRGESWYRSHFHTEQYKKRVADRLGYRPLNGESSPYYIWDPRIATRAHAVNPDLRAIMLVRDPVERAFSHWQERRQNGVEPLDFVDALDAEQRRLHGERERMVADPDYYSTAHDWYAYRERGIYLPQLLNWTSVFPRDQLLVVRSEDLYADVQGTVDRVCDFLGLPRTVLPSTRRFNASRRPAMPERARAELAEFYAPHNQELGRWLDRDLGWS